ncbi:MAG: hypothetical protein AB7P03_15150 [Kofleriaceae bacterium]
MRPGLVLAIAASACGSPVRDPVLGSSANAAPLAIDPPFAVAIRTAAASYQQWGRVDAKPKLAPALCRAPLPGNDGVAAAVRVSDAANSPHHDKLYYLWASDKPAYLSASAAIPRGFTIVKESFAAVALGANDPPPAPPSSTVTNEIPPRTDVHTTAGARLGIGERADLFVMHKVGDRAGSDQGWIYGTVSIDGTVTSAGRVERCMGCHEHATHERLFGLEDHTAR